MTPSDNDGVDDAQRLIHLLRGNFQDQGKTTCRDCLRTKTLPCPKVIEVADEQFVPDDSLSQILKKTQLLEKAYEIILADGTKFLPSKDDEQATSSLDCMNQISVTLRFIQLLLLLSKRQQDLSFLPGEAQVNKWIVSLLKAWTHGVCEWTRVCAERNATETKDCLTVDASTSLEQGPVFCYAFYSLLRMNEYVQTRGALMVPLWKGLLQLAKLLTVAPEDNDDDSSQNDTNSKDWRDSLPPNILGDALKVLGDFLHEGMGRLEFEALQHCSIREENNCKDRIAFQGKFVGFMVTRMTQLLKIYFYFREPKSSDPVLNGVWRSLLGLRGLASTLQLLCSADLIGKQTETKIDVDFLRAYCEIAAKAGKCVTDTILQKEEQIIHKSALESLLCSSMVTNDKDAFDDDYHQRQEYPEELQSKLVRVSLLARTMGKVSVLQQILAIANSRSIVGNIEALLVTVENLHSVSVPQCLSACLVAVRCSQNHNSTTPTTIVLGSLQVMALTLRKIEKSSEFMKSSKRDVFYRLLVRWQAGNADNSEHNNNEYTNKGVEIALQEHPLSRELVVSLIHALIVGSSENSQNRSGSSTKLLSYMAKLLMDPRTRTTLRRNIGAVLIRLQASSASSVACATTTKLVDKEFMSWLKHSDARQKLSKKRKRSRNGNHDVTNGLSQQDVMVISRVLSSRRGTSEASFSSLAPEEYQNVLRKEFTRLSSACSEEPPKSKKILLAMAERNSLLLAWLEGCVNTKSNAAFEAIRDITGLDLMVDIVRPVLTAVSSLRFKLGQNGDGNKLFKKKVMLHSAAIRLSVAWAIAFGDDGKLPIDKVCQLIKNSISKDPWRQADIEVSCRSLVEDQHSILKFEVVHLLGYVGKAIPSNCPDKILKVIRRAFVMCFNSSSNWAISSSGISSVMLFASHLHASHQHIIPHCFPQARMGLLQARTIGEVTEEETILDIVDKIAHLRCKAVGSPIQRILPSTITTSIAPGSYVLEMPTQEDRTATVIFPPGEKSLQDIQYMLGGMGDAQMTTQLLKRAVVTPCGVFKLLLIPS